MNKVALQTIEEIERTISEAEPEVQRKLLTDLPHLLKLSRADLSWLKLAESAFDFWNNPEDIVYDSL